MILYVCVFREVSWIKPETVSSRLPGYISTWNGPQKQLSLVKFNFVSSWPKRRGQLGSHLSGWAFALGKFWVWFIVCCLQVNVQPPWISCGVCFSIECSIFGPQMCVFCMGLWWPRCSSSEISLCTHCWRQAVCLLESFLGLGGTHWRFRLGLSLLLRALFAFAIIFALPLGDCRWLPAVIQLRALNPV